MRHFWLLLLVLLAGCASRPPAALTPPPGDRPPTILISVDGMRADYLERGVTPVLARLAAGGVRAKAMRPSFPSLTFPNHYTLVTGLRPDRHGIVNNSMEDAAIPGVRFSLSNRDAVTDRRWWDQAEPIWVTAEKAGITTATMFWPGSEAPIQGVRPTHWAVFDGKMPNEQRVDGLLRWWDAGARPGLMTLYFDEVDHAGHEFGPDATETTEAARHVDAAIGLLLDGLAARRITANIVIVADHGMIETGAARVIRIDQVAPPASFRIVTGGAVAGLVPAAGQDLVLADALLRRHANMQCWRKGRIPRRLHYGANPRVPPFICMAAPGWLIQGPQPVPQPGQPVPTLPAGMHGYDPAVPEMAAMFVAQGPAFRAGVVVPAFDNVDVYPLLAQLIGVAPLASDGSIKALRPGLR
jgi:predicted AlkP superfamily pyrophosphatase or phosphodiesterase